MFIIYKITNLINGKVYIGKTCRDIETRWREHKARAKQNKGYYLHNAILKYGEENFTIEIIEQTTQEEKINELEQKWIIFYSSTDRNKGYNLTTGGDGNKKYDWEEFRYLWDQGYSIKEISNIYKCERHTVGDALKNYPNYSYKESLRRSSYSKKPIDKYDLTGKLVRSYSSIIEAAEDVKGSPVTISKCLQNKTHSALGFFWVFQGEKIPESVIPVKTNKKRKVKQFDKNGNYLKTFSSAADAAREVKPDGNTNSVSSCILQVCDGKRKSAYGFVWEREED